VRTEPSGFSRGRQTKWTEDASAAEELARILTALSVSIGHDAVTIHPALMIEDNITSHPWVVL